MKQIKIYLSPEGTIRADTLNMDGHECQKYVTYLENLTDSVAVESIYKAEFFAEQNTKKVEAEVLTKSIRSELNG